MPDSLPNDDREQQLDSIIGRYYLATEQGHAPDQEQFVSQHPQFERELREFFADLGNLQGVIPCVEENPVLRDTMAMKDPPTRLIGPGSAVRYFGEYEILNELGIGGMGVVYKTRQSKLRRIVALKMIRSGELANPQDVQRFQAEAKAVAKLLHPGIVAVHEVGIHKGQHFYTMDFVSGGSLSNLHRDEPVPAKRAADLVRQLAEAVHYAHGEGIVHRDLKPANILLTEDGIPRITDFGLAKRMWISEDSIGSSMTETGQILGTAGYMSPEQAEGKSKLVGPPADIYSLGAVMYALLTCRAPFVGESKADTIMQVIHKDPVLPRALNQSVPHDLETICLKCLEKEPHKRYGTAQLLAEDLQRYLEGRPVIARPISRPARAWRWCRRNPVVAVLLTAVAASLVIGTGVSAYFADQSARRAETNLLLANKAHDARQLADQRKQQAESLSVEAETRRIHAEQQSRLARRRLYVAHMNLVQKAYEDGNRQIGTAFELLEQWQSKGAQEDLRGFEWYYWNRLLHQSIDTLRQHQAGVMAVVFSHDGRHMASASGKIVSVWDVETGKQLRTLKSPTGNIRHLAFDHDGSHIAGLSEHPYSAIRWSVTTGSLLSTLSVNNTDVLSPNGHQVVTLRHTDPNLGRSTVGLLEAAGGTMSWQCKSTTTMPTCIAISHNANYIAAASANGSVTIIDVKGERDATTITLVPNITRVSVSSDGTRVAAVFGGDTSLLWTGTEIVRLDGHTQSVTNLAFSPNGEILATASHDDTVRLWNSTTGTLHSMLKGHRSSVWGLSFSPDGTCLATASVDRTVKLWNLRPTSEPSTIRVEENPVTDVDFSPDGNLIASVDGRNAVCIYEVSTGNLLPALMLNDSDGDVGLNKVTFSRSGALLAAGGWGNSVTVWSLETQNVASTLNGHEAPILGITFSPDGKLVATTSYDQTVRIWDPLTGEQAWKPTIGKGDIAAAFNADSSRLAIASTDKSVRIWDVQTRRPILDLAKTTAVYSQLVYSPDGTKIAASGKDVGVQIWDALTGKSIVKCRGQKSGTAGIVYSPDGHRIATAGYDGDVRLWDVVTGEEMLALKGHTKQLSGIAFSPDGELLTSASSDGTVRLWRAPMTSRKPLTRANVRGTIVVDASKGSVWWYPQEKPDFDPKKDHQGKRLADHLIAQGWNVYEIAKGEDVTELLKGADIVIRMDCHNEYKESEVRAYCEYVAGGGNLLLLRGFVRDGQEDYDAVAAAFGVAFSQTVRAKTIKYWTEHPLAMDLDLLPYRIGSIVMKSPKSTVPIAFLDNNQLVMGIVKNGKGTVIFISTILPLLNVPQPFLNRTIEELTPKKSMPVQIPVINK